MDWAASHEPLAVAFLDVTLRNTSPDWETPGEESTLPPPTNKTAANETSEGTEVGGTEAAGANASATAATNATAAEGRAGTNTTPAPEAANAAPSLEATTRPPEATAAPPGAEEVNRSSTTFAPAAVGAGTGGADKKGKWSWLGLVALLAVLSPCCCGIHMVVGHIRLYLYGY